MTEPDDIEDGAVESGYGSDKLSRSSGGSMDPSDSPPASDESVSQSDPDPETVARSDSSGQTDAHATAVDGTNHDDSHSPDVDGGEGELRPFDWSSRGRDAKGEASPSRIDYCPQTRANGFPYVVGRSSVADGLKNTGARVRPELKHKIDRAINQARQEFPEDDVHKADFYEAALTVALWHHDEVLAVMAEHGYGIRQ